jgi:hypothetical protein
MSWKHFSFMTSGKFIANSKHLSVCTYEKLKKKIKIKEKLRKQNKNIQVYVRCNLIMQMHVQCMLTYSRICYKFHLMFKVNTKSTGNGNCCSLIWKIVASFNTHTHGTAQIRSCFYILEN